ncbi:MAG: hypothetical protein QM680_09245 [Luteolibacter sp.]
MLPSAFSQRLESFEAASGILCPEGEPPEAFVINRPFVDFAMWSTWAYALSELRDNVEERAILIRVR